MTPPRTLLLPLLVLLLLLPAGCGGKTGEEQVRPLPQEPETPVAADVEAGIEETAEELGEGPVDESTGEDSETSPDTEATEAAPALWAPPELGYNARQGKTLFEYYCATCHGAAGRGDGFNSYNLDPKPRDLTDPELQAERSDEDLAAVIRSGGGAAGLSTGMPPWGRTLTELQIRNLVVFVRLLPELAENEQG